MQLLTDKWIPVFKNGATSRVTLDEAMNLPLFDIQSGRPDFDFALLLFAVGIKQTGYEPPPVFGNGERFLQTADALEGTKKPIGQLLLDEPGENAIRNNLDFLVRGNQRNRLCTSCASIALYVNSQFRGPQGPGLYPGNLFHNAVYLISKTTFGETVTANLVSKNIDASAYFSVANRYWLEEPKENAECALCGAYGPVVTSVWRRKLGTKPEAAASPHCARTKSGKRYAIAPWHSNIHIIEGCAPDSQTSISPLAISENGQVGDEVLGFGTYYDKAALRRMFLERFKLRPSIDMGPPTRAIKSIWNMRMPRSQKIEYSSTFAAEIMANISQRVMSGANGFTAALKTFDDYCPNPGPANQAKYADWKHWRNRI